MLYWHGKTSALLLHPLARCPAVPAAGLHPATKVSPLIAQAPFWLGRGEGGCSAYGSGVHWGLVAGPPLFLVLEPLCSSSAVQAFLGSARR